MNDKPYDWFEDFDTEFRSALEICNEIVTPFEQQHIVAAAECCHNESFVTAALHRNTAGYL